MRLPPGFEARGNPAPDRRMSVYRDGDLVGRYWRRHRARGFRWESMNGGPERPIVIIDEPYTSALRIERICPRCHERNYHHANRKPLTVNGRQRWTVKIKCACGMEWRGRYIAWEWT